MTLHAAVVRRIRKGGDVNSTAADVIAIVQSNPSTAGRALRYVNSPAQQEAARRNGRQGGKPRKYELQPGDVVMLRKSAAADRHDETAVVVETNGVYVYTVPRLSEWNPWHVSELKRIKRAVQRTTKKGQDDENSSSPL